MRSVIRSIRHSRRRLSMRLESHGMLGNVLTAIVTPFREDGSIDFDAFQRLARFLVENGSDGGVVAGTTGESPTLSDGEPLHLVKAAPRAVPGKTGRGGTRAQYT